MNTALEVVNKKFLKVTIGFVVDASLIDEMSALSDALVTLQSYGEAAITNIEIIEGNYSDNGEWIPGESN
jgi:hypothetical protein